MKQRFSSLDVKVIAKELNRSLTNLRVSNIYDLSTRIFLFKCAKPGSKAQLIVDSGFRCHLTSFTRTAASQPSSFVEKLRRTLKSRRITKVSQIGTDRVIEISFSDGQYRLFLEFFAAGNIILTDAELTVLALLRQVSEGDEDVDVKIGGKYVLDAKQNFHGVPLVSEQRVKDCLENQIAKVKAANETGGKKAKRHKGGDDLRRALSIGFPEFPPHLLEHAFLEMKLDTTTKAEDVLTSAELMNKVLQALSKAGEIFRSLDSSNESKGYIIAKIKESSAENKQLMNEAQPPRDALLYDDFHPFKPSQFEANANTIVLEYDNFNKTVDEFFSSIESQQLESRLTERENAAQRKLRSAKDEHEKRLAGLQQAQEMHIRKAQAIEANTHRVEEAIAAVNGLVGQGMDWVDIGKLIENEQGRNNAVAQMIKLPLKLYENTVTLLLDEPGIEEDSDDEDVTDSEYDSDTEEKASVVSKEKADKRLSIDIDLGLSPWANARQYYDQKKVAAQKQERTVAASEKAFKSMEKKTALDLKKDLKQEKAALRPARKQFWFEKFLFFISSEGYLVLGGKDAQQNEVLYRKYLKSGDIYVHADLHGASSVIVKNNPSTPDAPIPPSTLSQAGALSVCSSNAWDSKAVMAAWWVKADQVSKTAPTGEYLTTGGFMVRGQKNFLPPSQLLLGFSVYWLISEDSRTNHGKHKLFKTESMVEGEAELLAADARGLAITDDEISTEQTPDKRRSEDPVPDIEDAAQEAEKEIENDQTADASEDEDDNSDGASVDTDNESGFQRSNPLQENGVTNDSETNYELEPQYESKSARLGDATLDKDGSEEPESDSDAADQTTQDKDLTTSKELPAKDNVGSKSKPQQPKRGANTKAAKRKAAKYAMQDEEDRALAMELLGSTKAEQRKQAEADTKAAREAKAQADKERRRQQHLKAAEAEKSRQERLARKQQGLKTDDIEEDEESAELAEQERREHLNIDLLVPAPEPGDEIVAAVPVVAPWTALSRCKFKVKLQPGNVKKGKAVKEIISTWAALGSKGPKVIDENNQDRDKIWVREVECLKALKWEEAVGILPVKGLRIVQSGGMGGSGGSSGGGKGKSGSGGARSGKGSKKSR